MSGLEIERKFLVKDDSYKQLAFSYSRIKQGYICSGHGRTVRVRLRDRCGYLTIKGYDERFKKYQLGFPNKEVEEGFLNLLLPLYNSAGDRSSFMVDELEA